MRPPGLTLAALWPGLVTPRVRTAPFENFLIKMLPYDTGRTLANRNHSGGERSPYDTGRNLTNRNHSGRGSPNDTPPNPTNRNHSGGGR